MKLLHKGIILVSVPLVFELVFVGTLTVFYKKAEDAKRREASARVIVSCANSLFQHLYNGSVAIVGHTILDNPALLKRSDTEMRLARDNIKVLGTFYTDPKRKEAYRRTILLAEDLGARLREYRENSLAGEPNMTFFGQYEIATRFHKLMDGLFLELNRLVEDQKLVQREGEAEAQRWDTLFNLCIALGIMVNFGVALALAVFFGRSITNRLNVLTSNNVRFAAAQPLIPPLAGDDEIAGLDKSFHTMANLLVVARRKEESIVENAHEVICSIDAAGRFTRLNKACHAVFGRPPSELLNQRAINIVDEDDKTKFGDYLAKARTELSVVAREIVICLGDGSERYTQWSFTWSPEEETVICVVLDLSERKAIEKLRREYYSMISHDLRSPLTSMLLTLEALQKNIYGVLPDKAKNRTIQAGQSARMLIELVNNILEVEKLDSGMVSPSLTVIEVVPLVEEALTVVRGLAEAKSVELQSKYTPFAFRADGELLLRLLVNLLTNAIKYSPENGVVTLSAQMVEGTVRVAVSDQGPGIPEEHREAVFARFRQLENQDESLMKGSGLGLAICRAIVQAHGGTISVDSEVGKGSCFWFSIPWLDPLTSDDSNANAS